jgi:hypothetical protein
MPLADESMDVPTFSPSSLGEIVVPRIAAVKPQFRSAVASKRLGAFHYLDMRPSVTADQNPTGFRIVQWGARVSIDPLDDNPIYDDQSQA